jgi:hypothetical protein
MNILLIDAGQVYLSPTKRCDGGTSWPNWPELDRVPLSVPTKRWIVLLLNPQR